VSALLIDESHWPLVVIRPVADIDAAAVAALQGQFDEFLQRQEVFGGVLVTGKPISISAGALATHALWARARHTEITRLCRVAAWVVRDRRYAVVLSLVGRVLSTPYSRALFEDEDAAIAWALANLQGQRPGSRRTG
jgi:hypothetical protein